MYNPQDIEPKWQADWENKQLFQNSAGVETNPAQKMMLLFAFAYPSGSGLHVGHVESKTALDIMARFYRMNGKDVFFPVGWDAFGLPAENYAIKTGIPPVETTRSAIDTFRRQIKRIGVSYDWASEIATCHPEYYRWTQWLFLQLYEKGLAYRKTGMVNWCPQDQTVLANEQVVNGECERCGTQVIQKELEQWYFKITDYQDELISGLDTVDWPAPTKQHQVNWIGKSEGVEVHFPVLVDGQQSPDQLDIFTTAHDTIYGCTFMVVAPEHPLLKKYQQSIANYAEIEKYVLESQSKNELDRQMQKDKTGVEVKGITLLNPVTQQEVPLFVADYVLAGYGTGAIMAVPGHDERDGQFAQKYGLPTIFVTEPAQFVSYSEIKNAPTRYKLANSGEFNGLNFEEGRAAILAKIEQLKVGTARNEYKLRDWLISRQRYWGAPIPIVYDPAGQAHPVKAEHLPWLLPTDVEFKPTGESPLKLSKEFVERTERLYGPGWRPEFDTMDTFVDSSWYFLRYTDARNQQVFADPAQLAKWLPADLYMIGPEHIVLHLLYARFFTKFLRDQGFLKFDEPFMKMRHQGMILGPDGKKMSKSKGNVISPDEIVEKFGADTLRVYEMFMGPLESDKPWNITAVAGIYRFLQRVHKAVTAQVGSQVTKPDAQVLRAYHQLVAKVSDDVPRLKYNTSIAAMMEFLNEWERVPAGIGQTELDGFVRLLAPFAPFLAEELYHQLHGEEAESVHLQSWPVFDPMLTQTQEVTIPVQVNGKVRAQLVVSVSMVDDKEALIKQALQLEKVQAWTLDKKLQQSIYVTGKILNLVVS